MFKKHSLQVKFVKDRNDLTNDLTVAERIAPMTPEEIEEMTRKVVRQVAIHVGAVIVVKIGVAVALGVIAKKLEESTK